LDVRSPSPAHLTKAQVHGFAERAAAALAYGFGDPLEPLVARLGGHIRARGHADETTDSIRVEPDGSFAIVVSSISSAERDRFTIAHELGHLFLHFPLIEKNHPGAAMVATRWVGETDPEQRRAEWEANWFAAGFLMPGAAFIDAFEKRQRNLRAVAGYFGVSSHAAERRAKALGLI
jgi:hypothetical protein